MTSMVQGQEQKILNKNQLAPFSGVLVPETTYRKIFADSEAAPMLQKVLNERSEQLTTLEISSEKAQVYYFGAGTALGLLLGVALKK